MPIYEFHCTACKRDSEDLLRSTDWEGTRCPHCDSARLVKKLSVFASAIGGGEELPPCGGDPGACGRCSVGGPPYCH